MKGRATVQCGQCCKPIVFGEGLFCFKAPGKRAIGSFTAGFDPAIVGMATSYAEVTLEI